MSLYILYFINSYLVPIGEYMIVLFTIQSLSSDTPDILATLQSTHALLKPSSLRPLLWTRGAAAVIELALDEMPPATEMFPLDKESRGSIHCDNIIKKHSMTKWIYEL